MPPLVSAIIPTYNYGQFIAGAVESVLAQTYQEIECIVVDDGSTDDSQETLRAFGSRVTCFRQDRRGPMAARNLGIRESRGTYVAFLDSDDLWHREKVARQMELMISSPDIAAVGCGLRHISEDGSVIDSESPQLPSRDKATSFRRVAARQLWIGGSLSGILARKTLFDEIGDFDVSIFAGEDWDMWMRLAARHGFTNLPEPLVDIRIHPHGAFRNLERVEGAQWQVYETALQRYPDLLDNNTRRKMRALIHADAGGEHVSRGELELAVKRYRQALAQWPWDWKRRYKILRLNLRLLASSNRRAGIL